MLFIWRLAEAAWLINVAWLCINESISASVIEVTSIAACDTALPPKITKPLCCTLIVLVKTASLLPTCSRCAFSERVHEVIASSVIEVVSKIPDLVMWPPAVVTLFNWATTWLETVRCIESVWLIWLVCEWTSLTISWLAILVVLTAATLLITTPLCWLTAVDTKSSAVAVSANLPVWLAAEEPISSELNFVVSRVGTAIVLPPIRWIDSFVCLTAWLNCSLAFCVSPKASTSLAVKLAIWSGVICETSVAEPRVAVPLQTSLTAFWIMASPEAVADKLTTCFLPASRIASGVIEAALISAPRIKVPPILVIACLFCKAAFNWLSTSATASKTAACALASETISATVLPVTSIEDPLETLPPTLATIEAALTSAFDNITLLLITWLTNDACDWPIAIICEPVLSETSIALPGLTLPPKMVPDPFLIISANDWSTTLTALKRPNWTSTADLIWSTVILLAVLTDPPALTNPALRLTASEIPSTIEFNTLSAEAVAETIASWWATIEAITFDVKSVVSISLPGLVIPPIALIAAELVETTRSIPRSAEAVSLIRALCLATSLATSSGVILSAVLTVPDWLIVPPTLMISPVALSTSLLIWASADPVALTIASWCLTIESTCSGVKLVVSIALPGFSTPLTAEIADALSLTNL